MDSGREHDLYALHQELSDITLSVKERRRAYRTFCRIQRQIKDRHLTTMRHRMIRAKIDDNIPEAENIALQITEYIFKTYGYWI